MSDLRFALGTVAFFAGAALIVLVFIAGVVGLTVWYGNTSTSCPDGQVYVTTETIRGCMPWEEANR